MCACPNRISDVSNRSARFEAHQRTTRGLCRKQPEGFSASNIEKRPYLMTHTGMSILRFRRKRKHEHGAGPAAGHGDERAAMLLRDAAAERQAEAEPSGLGR